MTKRQFKKEVNDQEDGLAYFSVGQASKCTNPIQKIFTNDFPFISEEFTY